MSALSVGIDLGTTHTVVAHGEPGGVPRVFLVPQLVGPGEVDVQPLLTSALFTPAPGDDLTDPYDELPWTVGDYALRRGREIPSRLIVSAKSWLCHPGVDRRAAILPWGTADSDVPKISPIEASRRILDHVRKTWDAAFPAHPLREQNVVLTVPASFDEVARELTVEAASEAGLDIRLLEEPQAAFYDYLQTGGAEAVESLLATRERVTVLVCDVGGGTTDLTLIQAQKAANGALDLTRIAVGRHLLLGGDNIDLALAHACERKLTGDDPLDPTRFASLLLACRHAKERLLGAEPPDAVPIRVAGSGSALVGGTLSTELSRAEVETLVFDGFLPLIERGAPTPKPRAGLVSFGLPYERDPAISRHIIAFLERHGADGVDAILLNGGLFKSGRAAERVRDLIAAYGGRTVELLPFPDPDLAVARGAVAFASTLNTEGAGEGAKPPTRIGGGTSRGFYVAVDAGETRRAVCVVPKGAREGERHIARPLGLRLRVGEATSFALFTSDRRVNAPGDIVELDDDFAALPPVAASFAAGAAGAASGRAELEIALEGELSAAGTVDLACVEVAAPEGSSPQRFRLAFELRERARESPSAPPSKSLPPRSSASAHPNLAAAREAIQRVFGDGRHDVKPREVKDLVRELERLLGERPTWTLDTNRALFDVIASGRNARKRSEDHERVFWMLAGYTLRPGFGDPRDSARVGLLVPLFETGVSLATNPRAWQQFWIAWRRIGAGLREETQVRIRDAVDPFLAPAELKLKKRKTLKPEAPEELLELAASLERIPVERRVALGRWVLDRTWTNRDPRLWAVLGRLGARVPAYGSAHHVIPISVTEEWVDHLLRTRWNEVPTAAHAALQLARVTGDRTRDLSAAVREEVAKRLKEVGALEDWVRAVSEFVPVGAVEQAGFLGEELPVGLVLGPG
jgi:molecular chaperone DnaK (HSP70)